jgi:exo-beta-1,3-glucanase (GH17 family)
MICMNRPKTVFAALLIGAASLVSCNEPSTESTPMKTASDILGNPEYRAVSYGGYRVTTREVQPTIAELQDDLKIMHAMGIRILRTYNLQLDQAPNILKAIRGLKEEDPSFEMYVMLGAWIDCLHAWTDHPNHDVEDEENNTSEIQKAVTYANEYPDIVKVIAVGNESMVHWAWSYFVKPGVVLKYVNYLQELKSIGKLPSSIWITSSDNFASWGGGSPDYHNDDLNALINAVDYISMHTYPFHDTHYNPGFWEVHESAVADADSMERVELAMRRTMHYAKNQYNGVKEYMESIGADKPIHIGETGWASVSRGLYGPNGSYAADELKQALYRNQMRSWTDSAGISCFYFEAFDEPWKDPNHKEGSENNFGVITLDGQAKYALWPLVDQGVFKGLTRNGNPITKTFGGDEEALLKTVLTPKTVNE